jgi:ABC-type cobalt transport system substrate-binding protein
VSLRQRLPKDVAWIVGLVVLVFSVSGFGADSSAYWRGLRGAGYGSLTYTDYHYAPVFTQVFRPLAMVMPQTAFSVLFSLFARAGVVWLLRPLGWRLALPWTLACSQQWLSGNIDWAIAVALVAGFRRPALWAVPFFTKIVNTLGPVWFLVRGEWRRFAESVGTIVAVGLLSWLVSPTEWTAYIAFLMDNALKSGVVPTQILGLPFQLRAGVALLLVIWGARTDRLWTLPVAVTLASPVLHLGPLCILAALPRLTGLGTASTYRAVGDSEASAGLTPPLS